MLTLHAWPLRRHGGRSRPTKHISTAAHPAAGIHCVELWQTQLTVRQQGLLEDRAMGCGHTRMTDILHSAGEQLRCEAWLRQPGPLGKCPAALPCLGQEGQS
jgi:hypothetical protein